jgi:hypothetical protein
MPGIVSGMNVPVTAPAKFRGNRSVCLRGAETHASTSPGGMYLLQREDVASQSFE